MKFLKFPGYPRFHTEHPRKLPPNDSFPLILVDALQEDPPPCRSNIRRLPCQAENVHRKPDWCEKPANTRKSQRSSNDWVDWFDQSPSKNTRIDFESSPRKMVSVKHTNLLPHMVIFPHNKVQGIREKSPIKSFHPNRVEMNMMWRKMILLNCYKLTQFSFCGFLFLNSKNKILFCFLGCENPLEFNEMRASRRKDILSNWRFRFQDYYIPALPSPFQGRLLVLDC